MDQQAETDLVEKVGAHLIEAVARVTLEEFRHQEAHFDEESRRGRELMYLAANSDWIRRTDEFVDLAAADSVETTLQIHVDLSKITHEAIRNRSGLIWLPLAVLPPSSGTTEQQQPTSLPSQLRDASGAAVMPLPHSQSRRWLAAAMAEVILQLGPLATVGEFSQRGLREHRLLLSAALYRTLRDGTYLTGAPIAMDAQLPSPDHDGERSNRIHAARVDLIQQLKGFRETKRAPGASPAGQRAAVLIGRAARIIHSLSSPITLVVVAVRANSAPSQFSICLPSRPLRMNPMSWPLRPQAEVELGMVLPSGDADRNLRVSLPEGVSFPEDGSGIRAEIETGTPQSRELLGELLQQILDRKPTVADDPVLRCLADLALQQLNLLLETHRYYQDTPHQRPDDHEVKTFLAWGEALRARLKDLAEGRIDSEVLAGIRQAHEVPDSPHLYRILRAFNDTPMTASVRVPAVEDRQARTSPRPDRARVRLRVVANKSAALYSAFHAGSMNLAVLTLVLVLILNLGSTFEADVLGGVLTLFAAVQASRIEQPDRSTLHGLLVSAGSWLAFASVLPTVLLGVTLAFSDDHKTMVPWAAGTAALVQATVVLVTRARPLAGTATWAQGRRDLRLSGGLNVDYERVDVLHTDWWRTTTAAALLQGRPAFGYLVRQDHGDLASVLGRTPGTPQPWRDGTIHPDPTTGKDTGTPANILAMLSVGTGTGSMSLLVFRERPFDRWREENQARQVNLDADHLVAYEADIGHIDLYIGLPQDAAVPLHSHPLRHVLAPISRNLRTVVGIQLPAPPPPTAPPDRFWVRIRVGLRSREVVSIGAFLAEIDRAVRSANTAVTELLVDVSTQSPARWFIGSPAHGPDTATPSLLSPQDLDATRAVMQRHKDRDWLVLGICAEARSGTELDILEQLHEQLREKTPSLEMAGMFTAMVHGLTVIFVLAHGQHGSISPATAQQLKFCHAQILVADSFCVPREFKPSSALQAGALLQMYVDSSDRAGLFRILLNHLEQNLAHLLKVEPDAISPTVLYAFSEVADGRRATSRAMIRLALKAEDEHLLTQSLERATQSLRTAIIALTPDPAEPSGSGTEGWWQAHPAVSLRVVRGPAE